ncbi:hypothetical protein MHYP_G00252160 [Metynnis hypsauchen]
MPPVSPDPVHTPPNKAGVLSLPSIPRSRPVHILMVTERPREPKPVQRTVRLPVEPFQPQAHGTFSRF